MRWAVALMVIAGMPTEPQRGSAADLTIRPSAVDLEGPEAFRQLLVTTATGGASRDVTREVTFTLADSTIASVNKRGLFEPRREGTTELRVAFQNSAANVPVTVRGLAKPARISFEHEIIPVLTKSRCNSGGCHGKAEGKNGFKLSVFGFDTVADYEALTRDGRQRRVFPPAPESSLLVQKGTAAVPHGGGRKLMPGSIAHRRLTRWIREGATFEGDSSPITGIRVFPEEQVLHAGETQQLQVTAIDAEGRERCVTVEAEYESNAGSVAEVDPLGLITAASAPGEAAILVRYLEQVAVARITRPRSGSQFARPTEANFIDTLVWNRLERLGIEPSALADDATFLRRASLDTIGTLPTTDEARRFLQDGDPNKRARLVDDLLSRDEYADYWTMLWSDLLRVDRDKLGAPGAVAVTEWLRGQFAQNAPYDEFARAILTAKGDTFAATPAAVYTTIDTPEDLARSTSQLFLGVRIECAQCHHHPSDRWGQEDYFALAGFFTGVKRKSLPNGNPAITSIGGSDLPHPRTAMTIPARALGAEGADFSAAGDRREVLADWMTSPGNPHFARAIANRLWAHYFGRGLVEPIDDLRPTNPATNEPLLDALAAHLREVDYDLKAFTRTLLNSRVYQLAAATTLNIDDEQNFSHAQSRPVPAEVLLDAISQASGVPEKFNGWPEGHRAIQIWDNRLPSYFFRIFGRPVRASVCECERSNEPSIAQALHLMNSPELLDRIRSPKGRAAELAASDASPEEIIEELCLATLTRFPTGDERVLLVEAFANAADRRAGAGGVLWTLLNSKEFLYNH